MVTKRLAPLFLVSVFISSQVLAQDDWGQPNHQDSGWPIFPEDVRPPEPSLTSWDNFSQESKPSERKWRIGTEFTSITLGLFSKDSELIGGPFSSAHPDAKAFAFFARGEAASSLDSQTELGFRSHIGFWIANDEATESGLWVERRRFPSFLQEVTAGANYALGAMDISAFMRYYLKPRTKSPSGSYPWLEFGLGTLDYLRLGGSFEGQDDSFYDPLIDTSYLQVGEFNFEIDLDIGISYFLFENVSLDGRVNIASWNEKSVWNTPNLWGGDPPGDSKLNYLFDGTDPEISFFFSVWF